MQQLESNRSLLTKQATFVADAGALGPSLANHSLNTLTQRYSKYKRTKNEYNSCKDALIEQKSKCTQQMKDYQKCLQAIESNKTAEYLNELNELVATFKNISSAHAFDMVKDFLDNSAQMAIYLQSTQLSSGLDVLLTKQIATIQQSYDTLIEYGAISRYHPPNVHSQHRSTKYAEWCEYLTEHQSIQDCRDIVTQFQATIGKNAINKIPIQQVIAFSYQLQTNIGDGEFKLQKLHARLNVESNDSINDGDTIRTIVKYTNSFEEARKSIRTFLHEQNTTTQSTKIKQNIFALHCVTISTLCDLNKRLLMMENAAANSGDNMVDLTFNGNWVLDELYAHSAIMCEMASIIESAHREQATNTLNKEFLYAAKCLREIQNMHENLRVSNEQFSTTILSEALHGVISENKGVMDIITALSNLQESLQTIPELLTNLNLHLRRSGMLSPTLGSNTETTAHQACADVCVLRQKLDVLKLQLEQNDSMNVGGKLFLNINGLFERLDDEYDRLVDCLQHLSLRDDQRKIDQFKNSLDLAVSRISFLFFVIAFTIFRLNFSIVFSDINI